MGMARYSEAELEGYGDMKPRGKVEDCRQPDGGWGHQQKGVGKRAKKCWEGGKQKKKAGKEPDSGPSCK